MKHKALGIALALSLAASAGCSLIVGDIELPAEDPSPPRLDGALDLGADLRPSPDWGPDARLDGTPPDEGPAGDTGPDRGVDAGPDLDEGPPPPDAAPDLGPDLGPPSLAPRELAGRWRVYGVLGAQGLVDATLEIGVLGRPRWYFGELESPATLEGVGLRPQVLLSLPELDFDLRGALDPRTGLGILSSPRAVLFLSRSQVPVPEALLPAAYYAQARFPVVAGEFGVFGELPAGQGYIEDARRTVTGATPPAVRLNLYPDGDRWRLEDGATGGARWLSPAMRGRGALGLRQPGEGEGPAGLTLLWSSQVSTAIPVGEWLCAGLVTDGDQPVARTRQGRVDAGGQLRWASGGGAWLRPTDVALRVETTREPFFDRDIAFALPGPEGRVMALFNRDEGTGEIGYGFGLCVALGLE